MSVLLPTLGRSRGASRFQTNPSFYIASSKILSRFKGIHLHANSFHVLLCLLVLSSDSHGSKIFLVLFVSTNRSFVLFPLFFYLFLYLVPCILCSYLLYISHQFIFKILRLLMNCYPLRYNGSANLFTIPCSDDLSRS